MTKVKDRLKMIYREALSHKKGYDVAKVYAYSRAHPLASLYQKRKLFEERNADPADAKKKTADDQDDDYYSSSSSTDSI